ncbi:gamma-glutamyl phosphate reductase [Portibacter lacus]|uniref:Gamma-glutamyl phosphate reductase n=2 Tax=Portibacter lacus TaxID=1099794 RepID=A0AA37WDG0_9BACT|nr:gamma-glutamyl phosphate reductase [Portibacter lacus]
MIKILDSNRAKIIEANKKDLDLYDPTDRAMYDRLIVDDYKIDTMIKAVKEVKDQEDPVDKIISEIELENGLKIQNKTAPFGTIMIIYESRPDVTIEAAVLAFKANSKILLKGGKEAINSNLVLVECWHEALEKHDLPTDLITFLNMNRIQTQEFLIAPTEKLDLIVPRGGEKLIAFVKEHAKCAVLISGRGNNFMYIHDDAEWEKTIEVMLNAKTQKISACNALDKILINKNIDQYSSKIQNLRQIFMTNKVELAMHSSLADVVPSGNSFEKEEVWEEEFLSMKAMIGAVESIDEAIEMINMYSGGHSSIIMTEKTKAAKKFMEQVDSAAVYHNASTRFTDGGQMGVGAELAISTDKLHHRGPLGLEQLVTNKYYVFGDGHVRD